jgi:hypothetical protein
VTWLAPLLSPLSWASWFFGGGAAGTLAGVAGFGELVSTLVALGGALGFQIGVVRPIWNFIFRFESRPAANLEGCLFQEVEAVTSFNRRGEGLVRVSVDGHSDDVLARLDPAEASVGPRVKRGARLVIRDVDPRTNSCTVARR